MNPTEKNICPVCNGLGISQNDFCWNCNGSGTPRGETEGADYGVAEVYGKGEIKHGFVLSRNGFVKYNDYAELYNKHEELMAEYLSVRAKLHKIECESNRLR